MKKGTMKRVLACTLVSTMALAAGASAEELYYNTEGFPIVKEPITVTMAGLHEGSSDWENAIVLQNIESLMGIKIEATPYADSSVVQTQFATQIASDTLPDIMFGYSAVNKAIGNQYGEEGYLLDWTDYLDIMPNFAKFLEENPEFAAVTKTEDGSIYSIDRVRVAPLPQLGIYVSKADQEKYGFTLADIKTVDDFYEILKSIKEQNPDVIPFGFTSENIGFRSLPMIREAFGIESHNVNWTIGLDENGQVTLDAISEKGKAYFEYMNRLWEEGLVEEEAYVITSDEYQAKIRSGEYVFWFDWSYLQGGLGSPDGSCYQDYDILVALTSEYNETPTYIFTEPCNVASRCMVSAKTEYPEAIMRLMDYMFTEEGRRFFASGIEGETYDMVENEMGDMVVSYDNYWDKENYDSASAWVGQKLGMTNIFSIVQPSETLSLVKSASDEKLNDYIYNDSTYRCTLDAFTEKAIREQVEIRKYPDYKTTVLTGDEADAISQQVTDAQTLLDQYAAQFITGELDLETDWDAYVEQMKVFWDQIQPIYQVAYDRMYVNK